MTKRCSKRYSDATLKMKFRCVVMANVKTSNKEIQNATPRKQLGGGRKSTRKKSEKELANEKSARIMDGIAYW